MILLILGLLTLEPQTPALLILVLPTLGLPTLVLLTRGLAVSYTHLDVYKRQSHLLSVLIIATALL